MNKNLKIQQNVQFNENKTHDFYLWACRLSFCCTADQTFRWGPFHFDDLTMPTDHSSRVLSVVHGTLFQLKWLPILKWRKPNLACTEDANLWLLDNLHYRQFVNSHFVERTLKKPAKKPSVKSSESPKAAPDATAAEVIPNARWISRSDSIGDQINMGNRRGQGVFALRWRKKRTKKVLGVRVVRGSRYG